MSERQGDGFTRFVIEIEVDVWDFPTRDPREWDLRDMADMAFGEEPEEVMGVRIRQVAPGAAKGLILDSEWVRAEIEEARQWDLYDAEQIAAVDAATDEQINDAITSAIADSTWEELDGLRGDAIRLLARRRSDG